MDGQTDERMDGSTISSLSLTLTKVVGVEAGGMGVGTTIGLTPEHALSSLSFPSHLGHTSFQPGEVLRSQASPYALG